MTGDTLQLVQGRRPNNKAGGKLHAVTRRRRSSRATYLRVPRSAAAHSFSLKQIPRTAFLRGSGMRCPTTAASAEEDEPRPTSVSQHPALARLPAVLFLSFFLLSSSSFSINIHLGGSRRKPAQCVEGLFKDDLTDQGATVKMHRYS